MSYCVSLLRPEMETAYSEFWERLSAGQESVLAYHHLAYRDLLQACLGPDASPRYWIVQDQHGDRAKDYPIVAALPCFVKQSNVGPTYCSLPFFGPNAGVLCSYSEPDAPLWHRLLLKAAMAEATAAGAWSITFYTPLWFADFSWYEEVLAPDFLVVQKFTQHMPLSSPPKWPSTRWRNIRRAESAGLQVVASPTCEQAEQFWALYLQNCKEYEIPPKPHAYLEKILKELWPQGLAQFMVVIDPTNNGRVVAGLITLTSRRTLSYCMPGYDSSYRVHQPMAPLIDQTALDAVAKGLTLWNWESSPGRDDGVYVYKARWGSSESDYRIYVKPLRPLKEYQQLGPSGLAENFPFFFVYPFNELANSFQSIDATKGLRNDSGN